MNKDPKEEKCLDESDSDVQIVAKKYIHLYNGGFEYKATLHKEEYDYLDLTFGINHIGCISSEIKISSQGYETHFVTSDQMIEMAIEFLKTANALRGLERSRLDKDAASKYEHIKKPALKTIHSLEYLQKNLAKREVILEANELLESFCRKHVVEEKKKKTYSGEETNVSLDVLD